MLIARTFAAISNAEGKQGNLHWTVRHNLSTRFKGRTENLERIKKAILSSLSRLEKRNLQCYVITGMGGQGKSELCLKIVNELRPM